MAFADQKREPRMRNGLKTRLKTKKKSEKYQTDYTC